MRNTAQMEPKRHSTNGFTLIETLFSIIIFMVGILSLGAVLSAGIAYMNTSQQDFIAQQKATESVESIFTARDSGTLSFPSIQNVGNGAGIFLNGPAQLCDAGPDGIVGTADDNCAIPDAIVAPGPDGILGTADDIRTPLTNFRRTIVITNVPGNPALRTITVTINYTQGRLNRQYQVSTLISAVF
jgi:type II secretory pathway pseudopilin PulG